MSEKMMSLEISEDMVKPVLEKQIQAAILANIGDPAELIEKVVARTFEQKVDKNGKVDRNTYENRYDFLEQLTREAIRDAAKEAFRTWLEENKQLVKETVFRELNSPKRSKSIAKAFADAVEESLECKWSFGCDISFKKNE